MVLPAKSVLCMPCHAATFSIGDRITLFALAVFLLGMIGVGGLWFSADAAWESPFKGFGGVRRFASQIVAEVLFLRRLFRLSPARWAIHGLMFYPILLRLMFGLAALILSLTLPNAGLTRVLLDKNHPFTGLFFDVTGLMIIAGAAAAVLRSPEDRQPVPGTPAPGRSMTLLLGCVILTGFILEDMRIAMTGWPAGAGWSFVGYSLSLLMAGMEKLTGAYGYLWYIHAVLTGAFIALIPFTRMLHIITAPLSLMVEIQSHREDKG
jgi:nitrate reductase gamma subunit